MAPVEPNLRAVPGQSVSDSARARELYKYYQPRKTKSGAVDLDNDAGNIANATTSRNCPESEWDVPIRSSITSTKISSPDTALTAFAQLVSWRIGCQRSMISVIDGATQYFIAESTKTLDLVDSTKHDDGDELWMGCSQVSKSGRLCERTIELPPASPGEFSAFIVPDLSHDSRFNQLPFVSGPPFLKFYAGTPLITKRGIPIGSLFVVDDRVRAGLNHDEIRFMGTMASTTMRHLENVREVEEHRRGMKMSLGLASFVEGRSELVEADVEAEDEGTGVAGQFLADEPLIKSRSRAGSNRSSGANSKPDSLGSIDHKTREYSSALSKAEAAIISSSQGAIPSKMDLPSDTHWPDLPHSQTQSYDDTNVSVLFPAPDPLDKLASLPVSQEDSEALITKHLFSRAANLIREAFEVDGGSIFYDAQNTFASDYDQDAMSEEQAVISITKDDSEWPGIEIQESKIHVNKNVPSQPSTFPTTSDVRRGIFSRVSVEGHKIVEVLGFSTPQAASIHGEDFPGTHAFTQLDESSLHALLKRYPKGKLWTFEEDSAVSITSEDDRKIIQPSVPPLDRSQATIQRKRRRARSAAEAKILLRYFPGVRQLLFVPLWDSARSRWLSANFTWSTEPTRVLTKQSELAFLTAFGNSVMAECSRINTEIADQKKGDFIGSVSHELRSPLHGILASAEFLGEEIHEGFSKGLIETIDSCGRTLLDTINHILDFSKINHFEKNWRRSRRNGPNLTQPGSQGAGTGTLALRQSDLPMINLFADVDVSVVCEEVVEGVFAGMYYQNVTASNFDMVPDVRGKMADPKKSNGSSDSILINEEPSHHPEVAVILDIDIENYHFTTQPGAFRRVIMNLLGNALKYTSRGYVKIKLESAEMEDFHPGGELVAIPRCCVTLTVSDTGRGISSAFIRSKLFTPFAQENSLSSGTGLGLSIVRSIVALLEGRIQIKSELGRGTEVKITLPLLRELPKDVSAGSTPKSVSSTSRETDEVFESLRSGVMGKTVILHGFDNPSSDQLGNQSDQLLKASVSNFLTNWYGLAIVSSVDTADIVVTNEPNPETVHKLASPKGDRRRGPAVLALCSHSSRFDRAQLGPKLNPKTGYLAKPIGPLKLARALSQCLEGEIITPGLGPPAPGATQASSDLCNIFEELSLSPNGGEVLDNSRMAADSDNARKAIESPTPSAVEKFQEFPFPSLERPLALKNQSISADRDSHLSIANTDGVPPSFSSASVISDNKRDTQRAPNSPLKSASQLSSLPSPRLLLVDDNKINLRLLRTYMRKRRYDCIDEAENGLAAVNSVANKPEGYDIIFMDISMPVLDGFGATRQIRGLEAARQDATQTDGQTPLTSALIIALTGLASSRDQSEAFTCGVDLFLTKPVSFKEVGKMLDNWEANREKDIRFEGDAPTGT